eukprot:CAMPEP_0117657728 /NCGR_PEP_ID=MMETSP0804-20121206/5484_1 /TAXON_ID=1074897 /ORGANISM="Tetraselmis astigmatica, Strain CCMP880" /LENGTH=191 /DNA_ID=CAMNT_0005464199 /DNA_START=201 /DNA_END=776 /DNA_ORIENTATION=-
MTTQDSCFSALAAPSGPSSSILAALAASLSLAAGFSSLPADAFGPQSVQLDVTGYSMVSCPPGVSKDTKCIDVAADADLAASKSAFNSEVFGRVRFKSTGESALYGDFAEASDAGKMADIPGEITPGKNTVHFLVRLSNSFSEDTALDFVNLKARTYPGMRQDFRVMKPVTATEGDCPEAELGEPCEEIPF